MYDPGEATTKKLKEIRALGSEIIAAQTADGRRTNFDFISYADIVKQS